MITEKQRVERIEKSSRLIGKAVFNSILITLISFMPILFLTGQEEKLFTPLVLTKTFAMAGSAIIAITLVPALLVVFLKGKMVPEKKHPVARVFIKLYSPVINTCLKWKKTTIALSVALVIGSVPLIINIGSEFMPPLDEGSILFMPVTLPDASNSEIKRILQVQDKIIKSVPEVEHVLGKAGRVSSATDNSPMSMIETIILLKPQEEWRKGRSKQDIINELNSKLQIPGVVNGWTQPIINRINMLSTGIRTDVGIKVYGQNLDSINVWSHKVKEALRGIEGLEDLYVEPITGGKYLDISIDREAIGRYGLSVDDVNMIVESALGGVPLTTTVEGRQRFNVAARFGQNFRESFEDIKNILIQTKDYGSIPLSAIADVKVADGPSMIISENAMLRGTVLFNVRGRDLGSTVAEAKERLDKAIEKLPKGYFLEWSGQYENKVRAENQLKMILPVVLLIICVILYFTFHSIKDSLIVLTSIPVSLVGGAYSIYFFDVNFSVAVAVGFIALFGIAVETGVLMMVYLNESMANKERELQQKGLRMTVSAIKDAVYQGSVLRLRPKLMTVLVDILGLMPVLFATGTGSDVMKPITIPFVFGLITSTIFVLIVLPVIFQLVKEYELKKSVKLS
ncbi:MAG TPA: efflux RND transporter permease subunit [Cytophagaceae bacterium]